MSLLQFTLWALFFGSTLANSNSKYPTTSVQQSEQETLSFAQIQASPEKSQITNLNTFLAWVRKTNPQQLQRFTLMRKSQSLQAASDFKPRAIVMGPQSRFIFTFSELSNRVEAIEFKNNAFEFREISFDVKHGLKLSSANPARCMECHGSNLTPLWDSYEVWDGAYGKHDDAIIDLNAKYADRHEPKPELSEEYITYKKFKDSLKESPSSPYHFLQFPTGSEVSPFAPDTRYIDYTFRPNLNLTTQIAEMLSIQSSELIKKSPRFEQLKNTIAYYVGGCFSMTKNYVQREQIAASLDALFEQNGFFDKNIQNTAGQSTYIKTYAKLTLLLGLSQEDMNPSVKQRYWEYFQGSVYLDKMIFAKLNLDSLLNQKIPDPVAEYMNRNQAYLDSQNYDEEYNANIRAQELKNEQEIQACARIAEQSLQELQTPLLKLQSTAHKTLQMCSSCHAQGQNEKAPVIDFHDIDGIKKNEDLRKNILQRINSHDPEMRMPPGRRLPLRQLNDLNSLLEP